MISPVCGALMFTPGLNILANSSPVETAMIVVMQYIIRARDPNLPNVSVSSILVTPYRTEKKISGTTTIFSELVKIVCIGLRI